MSLESFHKKYSFRVTCEHVAGLVSPRVKAVGMRVKCVTCRYMYIYWCITITHMYHALHMGVSNIVCVHGLELHIEPCMVVSHHCYSIIDCTKYPLPLLNHATQDTIPLSPQLNQRLGKECSSLHCPVGFFNR